VIAVAPRRDHDSPKPDVARNVAEAELNAARSDADAAKPVALDEATLRHLIGVTGIYNAISGEELITLEMLGPWRRVAYGIDAKS
jgi:hypothetical protein